MAASGRVSPAQIPAEDVYPAELEILVQVARKAIEPADDAVQFPVRIDWSRLLRLAELHGLEAFLLRELYQGRVVVPPETLETLSRSCANVAARNLALGRELIQLSSDFRERDVDHLVYKGPSLAQMLHGTVSLRPSSDIDLVVHPRQAERAVAVLKQLGYYEKDRLTTGQIRAAVRYASQLSFVGAGVEVDLHWRFAPLAVSRSLNVDSIWQRATMVQLFGSELPSLRAEDLFVTLCLHASEHGWSQLSLFSDLGRLLKITPGFDWQMVSEHLRDPNTRRAVDVAILLMANCLAVKMPPESLRREVQVELLAARVVSEFWPDPERSPHQATKMKWILERCKGEPLSARLHWICGVILTPALTDFQAISLPGPLQSLYPVARIFRLAFRDSLVAKDRTHLPRNHT